MEPFLSYPECGQSRADVWLHYREGPMRLFFCCTAFLGVLLLSRSGVAAHHLTVMPANMPAGGERLRKAYLSQSLNISVALMSH